MKANRFIVNLLKYACIKADKKRYAHFSLDPNYEAKKDIAYLGDDNPLHQFDILYTTKELRKNVTIIDIHGGAYIFGKRQNNYSFASFFLEHGFDVVLIDYEYNNGKISNLDLVKDCANAISYLKNHLAEYNLSDNFVITGDSAGGHLALILSEMVANKDLANKIFGRDLDINLKACLVNCPVFDYVNIGKTQLTNSGRKRLIGLDCKSEDARKLICPKYNLGSLNVPLFASTCTNDFVRAESIDLKRTVEKTNIMFEFVDVESEKKEIGHVHNVMNPSYEESVYVNNKMLDFINKMVE